MESGMLGSNVSLEALSTFFSSNMIFVFFIYGLAFFVMGLAIALEARRSSALVLSASLPYLAVFALIHSFVEWIEMFLLIESHSPGLTWDTSSLRIIKLIMLTVSTAFLVQFGAELIVRTYRNHYWLRWVSAALFAFWVLNVLLFPHYSPLTNNELFVTTDACLRCHTPEMRVDVMSHEWTSGADVSARYILYLPGSILAALAIAIQGRLFANRMKLGKIGRDCYFAAAGFAANAFFAGLVVPPVAYFPDWLINYNSFFTAIGIPPQVFRALCALAIAFFIVRILRVFEIEHSRQLEAANNQRFAAQQEALEVQRKARAEIEELNRHLENRVEQRTREIQQRNKELATLNAIAATVSQSLDLEKILSDSLDEVLEVVAVDAGAIFLYDDEGKDLIPKVHRGLSPDLIGSIARLEMGQGMYGELAGFQTSTEHEAGEEGGQRKTAGLLQDGSRTVATVPLKSKGKLLGMMCIVGSDKRPLGGELQELLTAIAQQISLAIDNAQLFGETQNREKEADALYVVSTEISAVLDIGKILNSVVEKASLLLGTEAAILSLLDEKSGEIFVQATVGCHTEAQKHLRVPAGRGIGGRIVASGRPIRAYDYVTGTDFVHEAGVDDVVAEEGLRSFLGVPLKVGDRAFGALLVANRKPRDFSDRHENLLMRLGNHAAIAIENARLYGQVQNMAVLEERYRIAREMHDGLAQVLGYLNLKVRALAVAITKGELEQAGADLTEMDQVIQAAYADVRESILSLRTPILPGKGFVPTLNEYLQGYTNQSRVSASLEVKDEQAVMFSETVQLQLIRIIQEALANVRKHAKAKNAWVRFALDGVCAMITIEDDGRGFDPAEVPKDGRQHLGLQTMRERAESIGGTIRVDASPHKGTRVIVRLPVSRDGGGQDGTDANPFGR